MSNLRPTFSSVFNFLNKSKVAEAMNIVNTSTLDPETRLRELESHIGLCESSKSDGYIKTFALFSKVYYPSLQEFLDMWKGHIRPLFESFFFPWEIVVSQCVEKRYY